MKLLITLMALVSSFAVAASAPKICPAGTKETLSCVSQSSIPLFPFVSICVTSDKYKEVFISMSVGAGRLPDLMKTDTVQMGETITYEALGEESDNLTLVYTKGISNPKKTNGVLSYKTFMGEFTDDYRCKISQ